MIKVNNINFIVILYLTTNLSRLPACVSVSVSVCFNVCVCVCVCVYAHMCERANILVLFCFDNYAYTSMRIHTAHARAFMLKRVCFSLANCCFPSILKMCIAACKYRSQRRESNCCEVHKYLLTALQSSHSG